MVAVAILEKKALKMESTSLPNAILTNPCRELVELADLLGNVANNEEPLFSVVCRSVNVSHNSYELTEVLSAIKRRTSSLRELAASVQDGHVTARLRQKVLTALDSYASAFEPPFVVDQWSNTKATRLSDDVLFQMEAFSPIAEKYRPLKRLQESDLKEYTSQTLAAWHELKADADVPEWAKELVWKGIKQLNFVVEHLPFFGHEAVFDELILLRSRSYHLHTTLAASIPDKHEGLASFFEVLKVLAVVSELFCAPAHINNAVHDYQLWVEGPARPHIAPQVPLLPTSPSITPPLLKTNLSLPRPEGADVTGG